VPLIGFTVNQPEPQELALVVTANVAALVPLEVT
jgi:hypothetical protein